MKRSVIEQKLNDAMQRHSSAQCQERWLTDKINSFDREASDKRKDRQRERGKMVRASVTIAKLNALLGAQE